MTCPEHLMAKNLTPDLVGETFRAAGFNYIVKRPHRDAGWWECHVTSDGNLRGAIHIFHRNEIEEFLRKQA